MVINIVGGFGLGVLVYYSLLEEAYYYLVEHFALPEITPKYVSSVYLFVVFLWFLGTLSVALVRRLSKEVL